MALQIKSTSSSLPIHNRGNRSNKEKSSANKNVLPQSRKHVTIISKSLPNEEMKSQSIGIINHSKNNKHINSQRTTKSHCNFNQTISRRKFDYCKKCGDCKSISAVNKSKHSQQIPKPINRMSHNNKIGNSEQVHQYYKNDNFQQSTESVRLLNGFKKSSLDTIKEQTETQASSDYIFEIYTDSDEELGFLDSDDMDIIKNLKKFRQENYFECHSAKSRMSTHGSVTSLSNHTCVYRFYLNDRLFPIPLNMDHNNNVRCIECHLPLDEEKSKSLNGTIQTKVKLNDKVQDMVLILPVKEPLIIKERRKEIKKVDNDYLYFGIIKLNLDGDSVFNKTLPSDSLALRYQKGYKEFENVNKYEYDNMGRDDIVIIK